MHDRAAITIPPTSTRPRIVPTMAPTTALPWNALIAAVARATSDNAALSVVGAAVLLLS